MSRIPPMLSSANTVVRIGAAVMAIAVASTSAQASEDPFGIVQQAHSTSTAAARDPQALRALQVIVPSSAAAGDHHLYRSGFEQDLAAQICKAAAVRCVVQAVSRDPRTPGSALAPAPAQLFIWGSDIRLAPDVSERVTAAVETLAEEGTVAAIKRRWMRLDRPWPQPLRVGTDRARLTRAQGICRKLRAQCTFVQDADFDRLARQFDAGALQLVVHSQSWLFASKDLEDRISVP